MPLIRSLTASGFRVIVITQFDGYEKKIAHEVDHIYPLFISRKGVNLFVDMVTLINLIKKLADIKPDILLLFTIKPVIYGSIAARVMSIRHMAMITGLGTVFISQNWITIAVKYLYKFSLKKASAVFFQNTDDKELFLTNSLVDASVCKLTPGSGIELDKFQFSNFPKESNTTFLLIARMLRDKGVVEFVEAARRLKKLYPKTNFQLLGPLDVKNRTAISRTQMNNWVEEGIIEYLGETDDVSPFIKDSSCVVLPSYREGTSRVLLEAAAMGRPIVTSDVPGCKEVVEDNKNGFLCKAKDTFDLTEKLQKMILLPYDKKVKMGILGRKKVEDEFDSSIVCKIYQDAVIDVIL